MVVAAEHCNVVGMNWMIRNMYGHNLINYLRQSLSSGEWHSGIKYAQLLRNYLAAAAKKFWYGWVCRNAKKCRWRRQCKMLIPVALNECLIGQLRRRLLAYDVKSIRVLHSFSKVDPTISNLWPISADNVTVGRYQFYLKLI